MCLEISEYILGFEMIHQINNIPHVLKQHFLYQFHQFLYCSILTFIVIWNKEPNGIEIKH